MRTKSIFFISFLLFVLLFSVVSADTKINVKTLSNHDLSIYILDANKVYSSLDSFHKKSDGNGYISVTYTGTQNIFDIQVQVYDSDGKTNLVWERFKAHPNGKEAFFQLLPGNISSDYKALEDAAAAVAAEAAALEASKKAEEERKAALDNTSSISNSTGNSSRKFGLNAFAVLDSLKKVLYTLLGVLVLAVVVFLVVKYGIPLAKKKLALSANSTKDSSPNDRKLKATEEKLKDALIEINKLKNQDKIREAERKIEEEKKRLELLKKGVIS